MSQKRKAMRKFIQENRQEIDRIIVNHHPDLKALKSINDNERKVMVKNEPVLTEWAKREGVAVAA